VQDRDIVEMEDEQEVTCSLSNGHITTFTSDIEWPWSSIIFAVWTLSNSNILGISHVLSTICLHMYRKAHVACSKMKDFSRSHAVTYTDCDGISETVQNGVLVTTDH